MIIKGFKNSALTILSVFCACVTAAPPSTVLNPSEVKSDETVVQNTSKSKYSSPKNQTQKPAKKMDEKNADWLDINLRDVSGKTMTLRHWFQTNTKPVLVVLSATWCQPCMHELPFLASMQKTLADKLDVFVCFIDEIMTSDPKNPRLKPTLQKFNRRTDFLRLHYAADALAVMKKNNLFGMPSFLLFSPSGSILYKSTGVKQWDNASVQSDLLSHIKEQYGSAGTIKSSGQKGFQNQPIKQAPMNQSVFTTPQKG
jgi:thiol-disulfide isomerase/thioredoxin